MTHTTNRPTISKLTDKEAAFAQNIVDGMPQNRAWKKAYNSGMKLIRCATKGSALMKKPAVAQYVDELRQAMQDEKTLERKEKRLLLAKCARTNKEDWTKRIAAIRTDNEMTGDNAPQEVQVFGLQELLQMVRKKEKP